MPNTTDSLTPLTRSFYDRDVVTVARELLGKCLVRQSGEAAAAGIIVEVEAYAGASDPAAHSYRGPTRRNATMFGPPGHLYVYSIHARYCLNVVAEPEGVAHAVLIRALQPCAGIELMQRRRNRERLLDLARGPARLCEALAVDLSFDGRDLTKGREIWISESPVEIAAEIEPKIALSPRIGISSAKDSLLRFFLDGSPFVSGPRKFHTQRVRMIQSGTSSIVSRRR